MDLPTIWQQAVEAGATRQTYPPLAEAFTCTLASGKTVSLPAGTRLIMGVRRQESQYTHMVSTDNGLELPTASWKRRFAGDFSLEFNEFRQIRPMHRPAHNTHLAASNCGFACQAGQQDQPLSLLRRPVLFTHQACHSSWVAFANGSIIETSGHFLVVPGRVASPQVVTLPHRPQQMTHQDFVDLIEIHTAHQRQFLTFYNHLQAGGSQDHLHFQMVARSEAYALEHACIPLGSGVHRLGSYPARGYVAPLIEGLLLWPRIAKLEASGQPYNLVLLGQNVFLFARSEPASTANPLQARVASLELAGRFILHDYDLFQNATLAHLESTLSHNTTWIESE